MKNAPFLITHPSQLSKLTVWRFARTRGLGKLRLAEELINPEKEQWEKKLNRLYYACGCDTGAKALVLGILVSTVVAGYGYFGAEWKVGNTIWAVLASSFAMAMIGKLYGLMRANRRLGKLVQEIQTAWKAETLKVEKVVTCG